jgi:hypothetical protein
VFRDSAIGLSHHERSGTSRLQSHLGPAEEKLSREISPRVFSQQEFAARLKSKDRFLTSVVRGPKQILLGELA